MDYDFDLFVIGGGSGGVRAARTAAATGARVGLAEESRMGGTCVIRGCVPKKLMVFASGYPRQMEDARAYGWSACEPGSFDWQGFRGRLHSELDRLEQIYRNLLTGSDVEIFDCRATLADANTVRLGDGSTRTARTILIATGGRPAWPSMPNARLGIVSDHIFDLDEMPRRVLIIGGGYIACEFAGILNGLGCEVTQYYRGAQILRGFDDEARGLVAEGMQERGIDLHLGTNIQQMMLERDYDPQAMGGTASDAAMGAAPVQEMTDEDWQSCGRHGPVWVKSTTGQEGVFDQVLFATGRTPNTNGLGLENAGIELGRRGEIPVDAYSRTSAPSVYAIGDVTGRVQLTPVAIREGVAFTETVFKDNPTPIDHELIPSAIFTQPEMGTVGLSEEEARDQEPIEVYCTSFRPMQQAFAGRSDRVLMKLIVSVATRRVLGCHIVADHAGEMIQLAGVAIKMGATKEQFDQTCAVHPTIAEELVTMRDPVRTA